MSSTDLGLTSGGKPTILAVVEDTDVTTSSIITQNTPRRRVKAGSGVKVLDQMPKKQLPCTFCDKVFTKNFDLQQHIR